MSLLKAKIDQNAIPGAKKVKGQRPFFQPKLTVNQPNDVYEHEADTMADKVMRMPDTETAHQNFFRPAVTKVNRKCQHCEEEKKLQRKEETAESPAEEHNGLDHYVGTLASSGSPLPENSRKFFEPRFGQDFSGVRIHTDAVAAKSAQSINALAYTTGNNIVFNAGQYSPDSDRGKRLMAHELTHVVQQSNNVLPKLIQRDGPTGDPAQLDPSYRSPTYVQPGSIFDMGDTIFTLQWSPNGLQLGVPIPGAAPGADNAGITLGCPSGQRIVYHSGDCCPVGRYNQGSDTCCDEGQVPAGGGCADPTTFTTPPTPGFPPIPSTAACDVSQLNLSTGRCCTPPLVPYLRECVSPDVPPRRAPAQGISGTFSAGVINDYDIDAVGINRRQTVAYQSILSNLRLTLRNCPATVVTTTGFTDAPGMPDHNLLLAQNRADSLKLRLQLDLLSPPPPLSPLIIARGEGSANPVDTAAGAGYSARNRRVEVQMNVQCPPMRLGQPH